MLNLSSSKNTNLNLNKKEDEKNNENKEKENELPMLRTETSKKIDEEMKLINNRNPNLKNKEFEFKNFMEINSQKLLRFRDYFKKANVRDKILKRKQNVAKSVRTIDSMYPDLAKNYICYFPTENSFKRIKDSSDLSFISRKNRKRYNTIHTDTNPNNDSYQRKSVIYNIYLEQDKDKKRKKKKPYFESVEIKKQKVNNLEYETIYNSLLANEKKQDLVIPKVPENRRPSYQMNNIFRFNKNKLHEKHLFNNQN